MPLYIATPIPEARGRSEWAASHYYGPDVVEASNETMARIALNARHHRCLPLIRGRECLSSPWSLGELVDVVLAPVQG